MSSSPGAATPLSLSQHLQDVTEHLAGARTPQQVFDMILPLTLEALGAVAGVVLLINPAGDQLKIAATWGHETSAPSLWQNGPFDDQTPAGAVLVTREALYFESAAALNAVYPHLEARTGGVAAVTTAVVPIFLEDQALGSLILDFTAPHHFTAEEQHFLRILGAQCALAFNRMRLVADLQQQVHLRTAQLEEQVRAQDAFVAYTEAAGAETDVLQLAQQAVGVLTARFPECSSGYYALEGQLWTLQMHSEDLYATPELLHDLRSGLPLDTPLFAAAVQTGEPVFVDAWDAQREQIERADMYGTVAIYPLSQGGTLRGMFALGLKWQDRWEDRDRAVFRAVGRSLQLALERAEQARAFQTQNALLNARTQALEGFANLIQDLALETDRYALIRRAEQVVMSLLPDGYALYYEREEGRWRNKVQTGVLGTEPQQAAALQAVVDAGFPYDVPESLTVPWASQQPYYQDQYKRGGDTDAALVQHVSTVASLPVKVHGNIIGILAFVVFASNPWTPIEKAVMETVVRSLGLALERAQGLENLAQASRFNELILSNVGEGLTGVDLQGCTTFANPAALQLLGYAAAEFIGQPQHALIHHTRADGSPYPRDTCPIYAAFTAGQTQTVQGDVFWRKDGTSFPVEYTSTPIRNEAGQMTGAVLVFRDITQRQQAEAALHDSHQELQRSNAELEQFAYIASHDLQAPIRTVTSFAGIIERKYGSALDDRGRLYLQQIVNGGEHMKRLVDDLLAFSRVHTERRDLQSTDAGQVFDGVAQRLQDEVPGAVLKRGDLPVVLADAQQLDRLLQNLMSNGLKYQREGSVPDIHVSAQREGRFWRFAVSDNGIGIEPQYYERIFEIFQRLHGRETYAGTGIGLAVCKKIVERHGGRLWLDSTLGVGSTFFFTLPSTGG
ncbi:ATP-binding protein [Deinococcus sp. QL22]|uniref:ATP-binding protein n=1 Tax=Deinococcus sp. QL22 TaxID=2939437 RepID=UPI0020180C0B|nr:GAF domain-containing protein [Deinococcus sp. QL22]UQN10752.1 GAF domain-containing protein [Deinococcus sp. QL22]UQN10798.1 GAF domain-containing protein [Deinococcus sp. QL22]